MSSDGTNIHQPRLSIRHLTKSFGSVMANHDISLDVMPGELHCLLGENGAGKSTLCSCLFGLYHPDAGEIMIDGRLVAPRSPAEAIRAGIGMVHQHFVLVPSFTVLENISVGTGRGWQLGRAEALERIAVLCATYDVPLDPHRLVADLSVGEQQWVEIIKALFTGARLLILDEPSAVLTPDESNRLFLLIRRLTAEGISVLLITHKMAEVVKSDRVSVLRRGKLVASVRTSDVDRDRLTALMVGRIVAAVDKRMPKPSPGETMLAVEQLSLTRNGRRVLDGVSLTVRAAEIVGIAGVSGNGQDELFECLAGLQQPQAGTIALGGEAITSHSAAERIARGVGYVPSDRFRDGLTADLDLTENLVVGQHWQRPWRRGLVVNDAALDRNAHAAVERYAIAASSIHLACRKLSGGNAQKLILAREFARASRALLCNQPTRGLDVGASEFVRKEVLRKRDKDCAILLASEELDDLFALCSRIAVMFRGRILAVLDADQTSYDEVGRYMTGYGSEAAA